MQELLERSLTGVGLNDILDILIVTFIIYSLLSFIRETRAQQLLKGLTIIIVAYFAADFLKLHTISWILKGTFTIGIFALIVVFQPEIRRALEVMGRTHFTNRGRAAVDKEQAKHTVDEIVAAIDSFSKSRTGALLVFERETVLEDIIETGTVINADVSRELLGNLFYVGSPLHDGAAIIRGNKVIAAGCVLPLTENKELNKRRRAIQNRIDKAEAEIERLESEIAGLNELMSNPAIEQQKLETAYKMSGKLNEELEQQMSVWEEASMEMEVFEKGNGR